MKDLFLVKFWIINFKGFFYYIIMIFWMEYNKYIF